MGETHASFIVPNKVYESGPCSLNLALRAFLFHVLSSFFFEVIISLIQPNSRHISDEILIPEQNISLLSVVHSSFSLHFLRFFFIVVYNSVNS